MLSYDRLGKKPLLFKSFTGLTVQEFDEIYLEITKIGSVQPSGVENGCLKTGGKELISL
ncbi:MAG TPA: hypothetical protein VN703_08635 [Candidatus Sulfopaludibacter sp.]|nr:hypothetical protein [Candidatus Sulfopaludibacter sp.]